MRDQLYEAVILSSQNTCGADEFGGPGIQRIDGLLGQKDCVADGLVSCSTRTATLTASPISVN